MTRANSMLNSLEKKAAAISEPKNTLVFTMDLDNPELYYLDGNKGEKLTKGEIEKRYPDPSYLKIFVTYVNAWRGDL